MITWTPNFSLLGRNITFKSLYASWKIEEWGWSWEVCISKLHSSSYLDLTWGDMVSSALLRLPLISWELQLFSFITEHQMEPVSLLSENCLCGTPFRRGHLNQWHGMPDQRPTWGLTCAEESDFKKLSAFSLRSLAFPLNWARANPLGHALQGTAGRSNMTSSAKKGDERYRQLCFSPWKSINS